MVQFFVSKSEFLINHLIKGRIIGMGCSDSKTESLPKQAQIVVTKNKDKNAKFTQTAQKHESQAQAQEEEINKLKRKKNPKNPMNNQGKSAEIDKIKAQKDNITKIKRVKQLQSKPEDQKFISEIISKSRAKMAPFLPPSMISSENFMPIVHYSPKKKGDIISKELEKDYNRSRWQRLINQNPKQNLNNIQLNESYIVVNQTVKSPSKQRQIQRKLNEFRCQSTDTGRQKMKKIQKYEFLDMNRTLYL